MNVWTRPRLLRSLACLLLIGSAAAQTPPQTQVSLISEDSAVKPGSQVWLGIHFQLEPGWHIYWLNPGDAGEPPKVQWILPSGWTAGSIEWPAPERLTNAAGVDYGYNEQATLLMKLKVPATAKSGPAMIKADLKWLICKEMCVPQKGQVTLQLQVAPKPVSNESAKALIDSARGRLPKTIPAAWKINVLTNPREFLLNFMSGAKVDKAEFFPAEQQVIENASPQRLSSTSVRAQLALDKGDLARQAKALKGVLVLNDTDAYEINILIKR
jgi:DsbC/DsbD-like thiol-disulfide interchange protein